MIVVHGRLEILKYKKEFDAQMETICQKLGQKVLVIS
jgi:hypothetical protein